MPKPALQRNVLIKQWMKDLELDSTIFSVVGTTIFCKGCEKYVRTDQKFHLTQHLTTAKHKRFSALQNNQRRPQLKTEEKATEISSLKYNGGSSVCFLCCEQFENTASSVATFKALIQLLSPVFVEDLQKDFIIKNASFLNSIESQLKKTSSITYCINCIEELKPVMELFQQLNGIHVELTAIRELVCRKMQDSMQAEAVKCNQLGLQAKKLRQYLLRGVYTEVDLETQDLYSPIVQLERIGCQTTLPVSIEETKLHIETNADMSAGAEARVGDIDIDDTVYFDDFNDDLTLNDADLVGDIGNEDLKPSIELELETSAFLPTSILPVTTTRTTTHQEEGAEEPPKLQIKQKCKSKTTKAKSMLRRKTRPKKLKPLPPFICNECGKTFGSYPKLKQHRQTHIKPHECNLCDPPKKFAFIGQFKQHQITVHTESTKYEAKYVCTHCGKGFIQKALLDLHLQVHIPLEKKFTCPFCPLVFNFKHNMERHISVVHQRILKFLCSTCGWAFGNKQPLIDHMRSHTGEKPVKCKFCGKGFRDTKMCRAHQLTQHGGPLKYKCQLCPKAYATSSYLSTHMKTHKNKKNAEDKRITE